MKPLNPIALSKTGGRMENQDGTYPEPDQIDESSRLFIVCDGVGGAARGDVASGIACKRFPFHLENMEVSNPSTDDFQSALDRVSKDMRDYASGDPSAASMATTFTMVYLDEEKMTIGWCGDSRVYVIRNGKIQYHTFDHSLVGQMVRAGKLSWEEARTHPRSNVITRSLNAQNMAKADFKEFDKEALQEDDYILLCSDGVMEVFSNEDLAQLMDGKATPKKVAEEIDDECDLMSKDNYSFILFQLEIKKKLAG